MTNPLDSVWHMIHLQFKTHNLMNSYVVSATRTQSFSLHPIKRDGNWWFHLLQLRVNFANSALMLLPAAHGSAHFTTHSLEANALCFTDSTPLPCQPCCICDKHTSHYLDQMAKIPQSLYHPPGSVSCFAPSWNSNICFIGAYLHV